MAPWPGPLGVGQCINLTTAERVYNSTSTFNNLPMAGTSPWSMNVWLDLNPASLGTYYTWLAGFASYGTSGYGETRVLGSEGNDMFYWGYGEVPGQRLAVRHPVPHRQRVAHVHVHL